MKCNNNFTIANDMSNLLLSSIRQRDVKTLKNHLSKIDNPEIYLNQVYDQSHQQKCTLLMIACLHKYEDIVRILLSYSIIDLEIRNDVQLIEKEHNTVLFQDVTVLWVAAAIDDFNLVKLFVEHGAQINQTTKTNSTAFRCACFNSNIVMARYLHEHGADIHIAKHNNDTNLSAVVYHKDLKMAMYLVDELGCDVNESMDDGRSPLYFSVDSGSLELVQYLLDHNARNFRAKFNNLSPILLAAENRRSDIIDAITSQCSLLERIETEELLGSAFACGEHGVCDLNKSYEYFYHALELRSQYNLPKDLSLATVDVFHHRREAQTIDELDKVRSNDDNMYIEALLVRERLLGPSNPKYRHSLRYRGAYLADHRLHNQGILFWLYELNLRQQYSLSISKYDLRQWTSFFSDMIHLSLPIPFVIWQKIVKLVVEEMEHNKTDFDYNLHTLLFLITGISKVLAKKIISDDERKLFYREIYLIVQCQYVTKIDESSLLHLSLSERTFARDKFIYSICKYPCLYTSRVLLKCGSDVNAIDAAGETPLHVYVSNSNINDCTLIQYICNAGAHLDYVNALNESSMDIAYSLVIKQYLKMKTKHKLKCLCARLIRKNNIPYHGIITDSLIKFIEKH